MVGRPGKGKQKIQKWLLRVKPAASSTRVCESWAKWWPAQLSEAWLALGLTTKNTTSEGMALNLQMIHKI